MLRRFTGADSRAARLPHRRDRSAADRPPGHRGPAEQGQKGAVSAKRTHDPIAWSASVVCKERDAAVSEARECAFTVITMQPDSTCANRQGQGYTPRRGGGGEVGEGEGGNALHEFCRQMWEQEAPVPFVPRGGCAVPAPCRNTKSRGGGRGARWSHSVPSRAHYVFRGLSRSLSPLLASSPPRPPQWTGLSVVSLCRPVAAPLARPPVVNPSSAPTSSVSAAANRPTTAAPASEYFCLLLDVLNVAKATTFRLRCLVDGRSAASLSAVAASPPTSGTGAATPEGQALSGNAANSGGVGDAANTAEEITVEPSAMKTSVAALCAVFQQNAHSELVRA